MPTFPCANQVRKKLSRLCREHDLLLIAKKVPASVSTCPKKKNGVKDERKFGPLCPRSAFLVSTSKIARGCHRACKGGAWMPDAMPDGRGCIVGHYCASKGLRWSPARFCCTIPCAFLALEKQQQRQRPTSNLTAWRPGVTAMIPTDRSNKKSASLRL